MHESIQFRFISPRLVLLPTVLFCALLACRGSGVQGNLLSPDFSEPTPDTSLIDGLGVDLGVPPSPDITQPPNDQSPPTDQSVSTDQGNPQDTGPILGQFGSPCDGNDDCEDGWCVESNDGYVCTQECLQDCPQGFSCKAIQNTPIDVVFLCVPDFAKLCKPCGSNADCAGGTCVTFGTLDFCTGNCENSMCPDGYTCSEIEDPATGGLFQGCAPIQGTCGCSDGQVGQKQTCEWSNDVGTCYGFRTCSSDGAWTECDAQEPQVEICDGVDNDCNGFIDDGFEPTKPCETTNEFGTCTGMATCFGSVGWQCAAQVPIEELCNYKDDNCNDVVDEGFKEESGLYTSFEDCGSCGVSCDIGFPNAVSTDCDATKSPPQCVVTECEPGFYIIGDYQCFPESSGLCQQCSADANCSVPGSKCLELSDGNYCAAPCDTVSDCPDGYVCDEGSGSGQCIPATNSCSCDGSNTDLSIACQVKYTDGDQESVCYGTQSCEEEGWGACEVPEEVCNETDDNCDGQIDEGFKNAAGQYDGVTHCGNCENNCGSIPYPNASSVCDTTTGTAPFCTYNCDSNFFDVDLNPSNGCECEFLDSNDPPADGKDPNCDGIDGEINASVFVAKNGSDSNPGTIDEPMLSIQAAISKASNQGSRDVLVATGIYTSNIVLLPGVSVYGGYSGDFMVWDTVLYETVIFGATDDFDSPGAVHASNINGTGNEQSTVFAGFTVYGKDNSIPGQSSYGVYIKDCDERLIVRDNTIIGGDGADGTNGDHGTAGVGGNDGSSGVGAQNLNTTSCQQNNWNYGGAGGQKTCGSANVAGGKGGDSRCPLRDPPDQSSQENGSNGSNNTGNQGVGGSKGFDMAHTWPSCGTCTTPPDDLPWDAVNGADGSDGTNGNLGAGASDAQGQVNAAGFWVGGDGAQGGNGAAGGGGGGGGAGSGVEIKGSCSSNGGDDLGGTGGGAGSGGCGGNHGSGGGYGGGSFAVFVYWSNTPSTVPDLTDNNIKSGNAGDGGDGGNGGTGGLGGDGKLGGGQGLQGSNYWCARQGGRGGQGGDGGHGGGGGGGSGGIAAGIFVTGQGSLTLLNYQAPNNDFLSGGSGGNGGVGGASLGNPGGDATDGPAINTNF